MQYDVPPKGAQQPAPFVQFVRDLSGRPNARVRFVNEKVAQRYGNWGATTPPRVAKGERFRLEPKGVMYIPKSTAQAWESLTHDTGVQWSPESQARALLTLIHEARHLQGAKHSWDEGRVEKWALRQFTPTAVKRMGLDRARALDLLAKAIEYHNTLPKSYRPGGTPYIKPNGTLGFRP